MENIKIGDNLQIAGVQYQVINVLSCKECCLFNTRSCGILDPAISCGSKTHLGFQPIGYKNNGYIKSKQKSKINEKS